MRRRLVVGAVLAVGFVVTGPARAGPERARLVSEQELPPVHAQGVARAGDRWVVSGLNVLARLTDDLDVAGGLVGAPLEPPDYERGVQATATDPPASGARPSASDDLDPGWPPVLIAAVLAVVAAAVIVGATFYRRARAAARGR